MAPGSIIFEHRWVWGTGVRGSGEGSKDHYPRMTPPTLFLQFALGIPTGGRFTSEKSFVPIQFTEALSSRFLET